MLTALNSEEKTLPERAADKIIDMIVENALKPGDRLPTELELLQYLNVGRSTVREAIKLLVSQNIIEVRRGSGTFVREQTGVMDDPLGFRFVQDKLKLGLDLCEIRIMIEPDMAALAAERATREDLEQLREACLKVEELILQGKDYASGISGFILSLPSVQETAWFMPWCLFLLRRFHFYRHYQKRSP